MKILITGGAGFIGSHVADLLIEKSNDVVIVDNLSSGKEENVNPRAKFYLVDLDNFDEIKKIFKNENIEIVYHLAAQIDVRKSISDPVEDARINILNCLNLLELCKEYKVKRFIFSSTGGAIYGDGVDIPTSENSKEGPISPYGCAKLSIEKYLNFYNSVHNLNYTSLRYSNVYGPRQSSKGECGVVSVFFDYLFSGKQPVIFGGVQTRDFVFVSDVARANLLVLEDLESNIYNVGTGVETDIIFLFSKMNKFFGNKVEPVYIEKKKGDQLKSCLNSLKIKSKLGWKPLVNIDDGIGKTYLWFLEKFNKKKGIY